MADFQTAICGLSDLPAAPAVVQKLHRLMSEEAGSAELARAIVSDPALVARILKLVNSPFYGYTQGISSIKDAITILGSDAIHQIVLSTAVFHSFSVSDRTLDTRLFWEHSFAVGIVAKHLSRSAGRDIQNDTLVAGLLHDIGRLVYARCEPSMFTAFYVDRQATTSVEDEVEFFGMDHQQVGTLLAKEWHFPECILSSIGNHHAPEQASEEFRYMVSAVNIADLLCHVMQIGSSASSYVSEFFPSAWQVLKIEMGDLEQILLDALEEIDRSRNMLSSL